MNTRRGLRSALSTVETVVGLGTTEPDVNKELILMNMNQNKTVIVIFTHFRKGVALTKMKRGWH